MADQLELVTHGATRAEALDGARALAANYFNTDTDAVQGKVRYARAEYIDNETLAETSTPTVKHFTVESVWKTLDNQTEWLVG